MYNVNMSENELNLVYLIGLYLFLPIFPDIGMIIKTFGNAKQNVKTVEKISMFRRS